MQDVRSRCDAYLLYLAGLPWTRQQVKPTNRPTSAAWPLERLLWLSRSAKEVVLGTFRPTAKSLRGKKWELLSFVNAACFAVTKALGCFGAPALKLNAKLRASEENGVDILGHHWVWNWLGS